MIFAVLLIIVVLSVLYAIWRKNKHVRLLMEEYERALQGSDKKLALIAGRKYYQALRGYKTITALDELELMKAIDAMKGHRQ